MSDTISITKYLIGAKVISLTCRILTLDLWNSIGLNNITNSRKDIENKRINLSDYNTNKIYLRTIIRNTLVIERFIRMMVLEHKLMSPSMRPGDNNDEY